MSEQIKIKQDTITKICLLRSGPLNLVRKERSDDGDRRKHLQNKWLYGNNKEPQQDHSHDMDRLGYLRRWKS